MKANNEEPQRIGKIMEGLLSEKGLLTYCKEYSIIKKWPHIVDNSMAKNSSCERVEKGIVYVKISSAPWRQEALYMKEKLLKRIREELGCPTVKDIVFY
jgi:predicted nucleic acid-binding Zn ribbon protein